ncbi:hypothetical protein ACHAQJ_001810 [Trichoderma viride]
MDAKLHSFTKLPTELRLQIWKLALRPIGPDRPGAHFFSVANGLKDGDAIIKLRVRCNKEDSLTSDSHGYPYGFVPPNCTAGDDGYSWQRNNPSAYLWDFGLWNACEESREIIEEHYNMKYWDAQPLTHGYWRWYNLIPGACTSGFYVHENVPWRFILYPNRDLICLRPINPDTIQWHNKSCGPEGDFCRVNWFDATLGGFRNLAIEYDPAWNDITMDTDLCALFKEKGSRGFFMRALLRTWTHRMCLIDYSLRQKPGTDVDNYFSKGYRRKPKKFYGLGQVFTHVYDKTHQYYEASANGSALDFLNSLQKLFDKRVGSGAGPLDDVQDHDYSDCDSCGRFAADLFSRPFWVGCHFWVLACEKSI